MFLRFIIEFILVSCLVSLALSIIRAAWAALAGGSRQNFKPSPPSSESSLSRFVQDPVCGMYIDEKNAIMSGDHAFCSEECRRKWGAGTA